MLVREFGEIIEDRISEKQKMLLGGGIHPYSELFYVSTGNVLLEWIGKTYQAQAPALLLIAPNIPHQLFRLSSPFHGWYIELEKEREEEQLALETIVRWNEQQTRNSAYPTPLIAATLSSLSTSLQQHWHGPASRIGQEIIALDLHKLFLLIKAVTQAPYPLQETSRDGAQNRVVHQETHEITLQLIRYLEGTYTHEVCLHDLAGRAGFTPTYIIRLFKAQIGQTPMQYVQYLRLQAALGYLQETNLPIQNIAELVGLKSLHYFSRLFKQKFGESPSAWRRRNG